MSNKQSVSAETCRSLARQIADLLTTRGETLAVVETSAGGLLSSFLTDIAGASQWYVGAVVPYSNRLKQDLLDLSASEGVSQASALALARAGREKLGADWVVSETGIAGPQTARRSAKPVGLVAVAVVGATEAARETAFNDGGRRRNKLAFAWAGLNLLLETLQDSTR